MILRTLLKLDKGGTQTGELKNKKPMMMHKALHPIDGIDILYVTRKGGERRFTSIKECMDKAIQDLEEYKKEQREIVMAVNNSNNNRTAKVKRSRKQK